MRARAPGFAGARSRGPRRRHLAGERRSLQEQAARRRSACEAIEPRLGQTGMVFNPPELQTVYDRSACYQSLALLLRDESLCRLAR